MKSEKLRDSAEVSFPVGKGSQLFLNHLLTQLQYLGQLHNLSQKIIHPEDFFNCSKGSPNIQINVQKFTVLQFLVKQSKDPYLLEFFPAHF